MGENRIYFSRLDILRFIAFLLVFWQHAFAGAFVKSEVIESDLVKALTMTGGYGVQLFFVLSGFLITYLLIKEFDLNGKINLRNFYTRRALRIWPLYYIVMIVGVFILPSFFNTIQFCGSPQLSLLFLNNFDAHPECTTTVGMAWSVAIEEQFYMFWPLLFMALIRTPKILFFSSLSLFIFSFVFNILYPAESYFHTFGNILFLMAGCMGAIIYTRNGELVKSDKFLNRKGFVFSIIGALFFIVFMVPLKVIVLPVLFLYIILYLVSLDENSERITLFTRLGKYTYGMYMYHPALILLTKILFDKFGLNYTENISLHIAMSLSILLLTIFVSKLSYNIIEKPILAFKSRFASIKTRI